VAAAWIDSWLRDDMEVASWSTSSNAAPPPFAASPGPATSSSMMGPGGPSLVVAAPTSTVLDRYTLSLGFARSWTDDDTTWDGLEASACARMGIACIGGRIRGVFQSDLDVNATTADRSELVALATASIPLSLGQVSISPELGLGVGRVRTRRVEVCPGPPIVEPGGPMCDPTDPMCVMNPPVAPPPCLDASGTVTDQIYVGDDYDKVSYLPRVAVALRVSFPIVRHVWLDAVGSLSLSPITARTEFEPPTTMDPNTDPTIGVVTAMPGEPTRGYQLGIGLRVGAP
jgi:hypothetical protein